jgi:hypothetical protein
MNCLRWLATVLIILGLAACAQGGQAKAPYTAENMHDRGGDGGCVAAGLVECREPLAPGRTHPNPARMASCRAPRSGKT